MAVLVAVLAVNLSFAFSILGPDDTWQIPRIGYNPLNTDVGSAKNLGEEYRWNIRTITYGFDQSFRDYFGERGMDEVRKAIAILNALPPVSKMSSNLSEFSTDTRRVNNQAAALFLLDLKSEVLGALVEEMGLASSERYTWCLRDRRDIGGGVIQYLVIKRNFDPVTWTHSSFVNGTLYTYGIFEFVSPDWADALEFPVDPAAIGFTSVSSAADGLVSGFLNFGDFFTGLTRDDVGGLRYLYRPLNYNTEGLVFSNSVSSGGIPWTPVGGSGTNFINEALRPGVDKITFVEGKNDSEFGPFIPVTYTYRDYYVTNNHLLKQSLRATLNRPDIIFSADDLEPLSTGGSPVIFRRTDTSGWANNSALNGQAGRAGPGVIQPQIEITINTIGPHLFNYDFPDGIDFLFEENGSAGFNWGSFDGTTNAPVVYPVGSTIEALEQQVLGN